MPNAASFLIERVDVARPRVNRDWWVGGGDPSGRPPPIPRLASEIAETLDDAVRAKKRILLIDFENSCQNVTKDLYNRGDSLADDVLVCVISQLRPSFLLENDMRKFVWTGVAIGKKETSDLIIEQIIRDFAKRTTLFLLHGGDHRWYTVAQRYKLGAHVAEGNGMKKYAKSSADKVLQKWSLRKPPQSEKQ